MLPASSTASAPSPPEVSDKRSFLVTIPTPLRRCALGTVQFGLTYGIANRTGQPDIADMASILYRAAELGVDTLDTAAAYGDAEQRLGMLPADLRQMFRIITKASIGPGDTLGPDHAERLRASVLRSRDRLGCDRLAALLIHDSAALHRPGAEHIASTLMQMRAEGVVDQIGLSVYTQADIERGLTLFPPDLIQAPANLLDQRLFQSGMIAALDARGIEIHLRSLFLQGLLLMAPGELPDHLRPRAEPVIATMRHLAASLSTTPLALCLAFGLHHLPAGRLVLGVLSIGELDEIAVAMHAAEGLAPDWSQLAQDDPILLDPSRWPALKAEMQA